MVPVTGFVSLIGAGPGDPELITVRGQRALAAADVIVHDELVDRRILAPYAGRVLHGLGDRRAPAAHRQQRLHALLAAEAGAGRRVAHLKGGDPLLFARGTEEIEFLRARAIPYEVIPGITAAVAAAAYAELPLTRRRLASSVAFCTGHAAAITVPQADTLVYYMAAARLAEVAQRVLAEGWPATTPLTLVRQATRPEQTVLTTTLGRAAAGSVPMAPPLVALIGPGGKPLAGRVDRSWFTRARKVLVTGTSLEPYRGLGELVHTPLIRIAEPDDGAPFDAALRRLGGFDLIGFTSRYAVAALFDRLLRLGADSRRLAHATIAAVGRSTAAALRARGVLADVTAAPESTAGLLAALRSGPALAGRRVLLPRSEIADPELPAALRREGAAVTAVTAYRTLPVADPPRVDLSAFGAVLFTSPSAVDAFRRLYGSAPPAAVALWCRGPLTRAAARAAFGRGEPLPAVPAPDPPPAGNA